MHRTLPVCIALALFACTNDFTLQAGDEPVATVTQTSTLTLTVGQGGLAVDAGPDALISQGDAVALVGRVEGEANNLLFAWTQLDGIDVGPLATDARLALTAAR